MSIYTTKIFITKAKFKHHNFFSYEKVHYINSKNKVTITCLTHGDFSQTPEAHLQGRGCPKCKATKATIRNLSNTSVFIIKANKTFGNIFDYHKSCYVNSKTKIEIICSKHGSFWQRPATHLQGHGCFACMQDNLKSIKLHDTNLFIKNASIVHNKKWSYDNTVYIKSNIKTIITCKQHGNFQQTPNNHLNGQGCPKCTRKNFKFAKYHF